MEMLAEKSHFTVSRMARLLGVSRSGFYAWCKRGPSARAVRQERIEAKVAWFHAPVVRDDGWVIYSGGFVQRVGPLLDRS